VNSEFLITQNSIWILEVSGVDTLYLVVKKPSQSTKTLDLWIASSGKDRGVRDWFVVMKIQVNSKTLLNKEIVQQAMVETQQKGNSWQLWSS
jgi:hypothetical protein